MPRLPIVGSDDGTWGGILNEFLEVEHNADGTLNTSGTLGDYAPLASPTFTGTVTVPAPSNATDAVTKSYVDGLDGDNVKVTGDQSVAGVKTFTSAVRGNYSTDGKFFIGGTTGVGGFAGFYGDNSDSDANPRISINALTGIQMGTGSATPDTILTRSAAKQLSINSSEGTLAGNLSPTINAQTGTSYTLVTSDAGKQIVLFSAGTTITLPQDSDATIPVGTRIEFINLGVDSTFQAGTGASIVGSLSLNLPAGTSTTVTKYSSNSWYIGTYAGPDTDNYDLSHEHSVGFYGSRIGMNKWRMSTRDVKHVICWGDSVTQGVGVDSKTRSMTDGLRQIITNEMNEEVHEGFQPMYWSQGATAARYTTSGGWTAVTGQSASNLSPLGLNGSQIRSTNTTLRTITWTRPSHVLCTKFYIHWVDDSTVTSGAYWSYSIDGGSTWTEVATASPGTPTHNVEEVILDAADYDPATIMIRNANAAGGTYTNSPSFMGIDIRHSDYGWVVHNYGGAGASLSLATSLNSCGAVSASRSGDWSTLFEYFEPEMVIIEFSNDTAGYVQATFETAIDTACSTLSSYADLVAYGYPDQDRLSGGTYLADVRNHTREKVLEYNGVAVDMSQRWTSMANAKSLGFMPNVSFSIHPTELGDKDIASAIGRLLRSYA